MTRSTGIDDPGPAASEGDKMMADEGIVLCADISNSSITFDIKKKSRIKYISLLEVYGIDPAGAGKRMYEIMKVAGAAEEAQLDWFLVPHSVYSVSLPLFRLLKEKSASNRVTSIHFMESEDEKSLLSDHSGPLMNAYELILSPSAVIMPAADHVTAVTEEMTSSGSLILVHNTFIGADQIRQLKKRKDLYYCLCPGSNIYISDTVPPLDLIISEKCSIVIGTDSLSSNSQLSILNELRIIQEEFPGTRLTDLIAWATINGARALGAEDMTGSIEPGKKPGLVLIKDADLTGMKLLPSSSSVRLL
jgi:cytosine/adenosine deaminase-related metal-dependent hydrolase